jgi:hypothetical protein
VTLAGAYEQRIKEGKIVLTDEAELATETLTRVSIRRLSFFLKCLEENNLWDEAERYLADMGLTDVTISSEPIAAIQDLFRRKIAEGEQLNARARRMAACTGCGG